MQSFSRPLLTDQVLAHLSDLVASGTWPPGHPLPGEPELSTLLGVSRPVVRECIRVLASRGMLVTRQGKGSFVRHPDTWNIGEPLSFVVRADTAQLLNWTEVRAALEAGAARLAALRREPTDLAELDKRLADIEAASTPVEYLEADIAFHLAVAAASHNPQFPRLLRPLLRPLREQLSATAAEARFRELAKHEHSDIAAAVRSREAGVAADLATAHITRVRTEIYDIARSPGDGAPAPPTRRPPGSASKPKRPPSTARPGVPS